MTYFSDSEIPCSFVLLPFSTETEMKLTDVARASLGELKADYEFWLLSRRKLPWKVPSPETCEVLDLRLKPNPLGEGDGLHEASAYLLAV